MFSLINWFVPEERFAHDAEMAKRVRITFGVILALIVSVPIYAVVFYTSESWWAIAVELTALIIGSIYLLWIRRYGLSLILAQLGLLSLLLVFISLACFTGGHRSPALLWVVIIPMVALNITNRKSAFIWAGISIVALIAVFALGMLGFEFRMRLSPIQVDILTIFMLLGILLFFFAFGLIAIFNERRASEIIAMHNSKSFIIHKAIDESADAIVLFDAYGNNFYQNSTLNLLVGVDESVQFDRDRFVKLFPKRQQVRDIINQAHLGNPWYGEVEIQTSRKGTAPVLLRINAVKRESGDLMALIAVLTDISKLKEVEMTLRESEKKYRLVAENTTDAIWIRDLQLNLKYMSPSIEKIRGFTPEEIIQLPMEKNLTPESLVHINRMLESELEAALQNPGKGMIVETQNYCKDGSVIWMEDSIKFLFDEEGKPHQIIGVTRDITERKKAEAKLKAAQAELIENAHRAGMADIAAGTLHNVGNLLNSVKTSTQTVFEKIDRLPLLEFKKANEYLRDHIDGDVADSELRKLTEYYLTLEKGLETDQQAVTEELIRLKSKVDDIVNVIASQQRFAGFGGFSEEYSLERLIMDVLEIESPTLNALNIKIDTRFDEVPNTRIQKTKLLHVLINLIKNAEDALVNVNKNRRKIAIELMRDETEVIIRVNDNGSGISTEHQKKIFTHGFTTKAEGFGFGLHSCAIYMDDMKGKIWMESKGAGEGSSFFLSLPLDANS